MTSTKTELETTTLAGPPIVREVRDAFAPFCEKPWHAIALFSLGIVLGALVVVWHYSERLEALHVHIAAKDDLLAEYRQRLHLAPTDRTTFSMLSDAELRQRAFSLVSRLREFLRNFEVESRAASDAHFAAMRNTSNETERRAVWERQTA